MKYTSRFSRRSLGLAFAAVVVVAGAACGLPSSARAVAYSFSGSLDATDPSFNRPLSTTSLSAVGTNVHYDVQPFTVSLSGACTLSVDAGAFTPGTADDSFLCLYQTAFNPASPLTNLLAVDDDSGPGSLSLLTATLTAGTSYFMVTTTFTNAATGAYSDSITPANAVALVIPAAVPEPGSLALVGAGALGLAGWTRRKLRRS